MKATALRTSLGIALFLVVLLASAGCGSVATSSGDNSPALSVSQNTVLDQNLEPAKDERLRSGVLPNGMSWYILPCSDGETVEMRMVVHAGSFNETKDQLGMAHFVEHMLFNGTKHFAAGTLIKSGFSESRNASTWQDKTVYQQSLPNNNEDKLKDAFLVFQDCAMGMLFDPAEVDKERKVVHEEWRRGESSIDFYKEFYGNLDPKRAEVGQLPIGTGESILKTPVEQMKAFWDTWYRPERMSFFVSGPIDPDRFESLIAEYLGPVSAHGPAPVKEPSTEAPKLEGVHTALFTSSTEPDGWFTVYKPKPVDSKMTLGTFEHDLVRHLVSLAWKERMNRLISQGKIPFADSFGGSDHFWQGADFIKFGVDCKPGNITKDFEVFLREVRRIEVYGFTQSELDTVRGSLRDKLDRVLIQKESSSDQVERLMDYQAGQGLLLPPKVELDLSHTVLDKLTLEQFNKAAREWASLDNTYFHIGIPKDRDDLTPAEFSRAVKAASKLKVDPLLIADDKGSSKDLMAAGGSILTSQSIEDIGVEVWTLSNGSKVFWRKMDGDPRLQFRAVRLGGYARLDGKSYDTARMIGQLAYNAGSAGKSGSEYRAWLKQNGLSLNPWVNDYAEGFDGETSASQMELFFETLFRQATRQGFADQAVAATKQDYLNYVEVRKKDWETAQWAAHQSLLGKSNPRQLPIDEAGVGAMTPGLASAVWKQLYGTAKDYVFVICGNADPEAVKALCVKYLASIPSGSQETKDSPPQFDQTWELPESGLKSSKFMVGIGASRVRMVMYGYDKPWPERNDFYLDAATTVLKNRLFDRIREELGASYDPNVRSWHFDWPKARWGLAIEFACASGREANIIKAVKEELAVINNDPLDESTLDKIKETCNRHTNPLMIGFEGWADNLAYFGLRGIDPTIIPEIPSKVDELTVDSVRKWMMDNLGGSRWLEVQIQAR